MADPKKRILGAQFVKLSTEGDTFRGVLNRREDIIVQGNSTFRYTFDNDDGRWAMLGTREIDDALMDCRMGTDIEIKLLSEEVMDSGFTMKHFLIEAYE